MTIGELLITYEQNYVAFLQNHLGTSRLLQKYVGQQGHFKQGPETAAGKSSGFMPLRRTMALKARISLCNSSMPVYVKAEDWELYDGKNPASRIKKFCHRNSGRENHRSQTRVGPRSLQHRYNIVSEADLREASHKLHGHSLGPNHESTLTPITLPVNFLETLA